jgi:leader peptidase (prepilin peptidase)/N-methyltransferase
MNNLPFFDPAAWDLMFSTLPWLWPALAAFLGAILASFGGVIVDRIPRRRGWIPDGDGYFPPDPSVNIISPSRCICGVRLSPLSLVPVAGWLVSGGRCRSCKSAVPRIYPVIEAVSATASAAIAIHFGPCEAGIWTLCAWWTFVVIVWLDWKVLVIPDFLTVPLVLAGLLGSPFEPDVLSRVEAMSLLMTATWMIYTLMGFVLGSEVAEGDVILLGAGGAWLGIQSGLVLLCIAPLIFTAMALITRAAGLKFGPQTGNQQNDAVVPFGPAICLTFIALLWWSEAVPNIILRLQALLPAS